MRIVRSVSQLDDPWIDAVLARATELADGATPERRLGQRVGLVFLDTSLRTRVGFEAASGRLGAQAVVVSSARGNDRSMPEHWSHTVRTVAGYVECLVVRIPEFLAEAELPSGIAIPLISGGDGGSTGEHPTQAVLDLFAMQRLGGPIGELTVAVQGDLRMRAVRSLLSLLSRRKPRRMILVSDPRLFSAGLVPPALEERVEWRTPGHLDDVDVLYVAGIPHGALDENGRTELRVTDQTLAGLPNKGIILSPLPIIDEISTEVVHDERMCAFIQSDLGLHVRTAILERMLTG